MELVATPLWADMQQLLSFPPTGRLVPEMCPAPAESASSVVPW